MKEEYKNNIVPFPKSPVQAPQQPIIKEGVRNVTLFRNAVSSMPSLLEKIIAGKQCRVMSRIGGDDLIIDCENNGSVQILGLVKPKIVMRKSTGFAEELGNQWSDVLKTLRFMLYMPTRDQILYVYSNNQLLIGHGNQT